MTVLLLALQSALKYGIKKLTLAITMRYGISPDLDTQTILPESSIWDLAITVAEEDSLAE